MRYGSSKLTGKKRCPHLGKKSSMYNSIALLNMSTNICHYINNAILHLCFVYFTQHFHEFGAYSQFADKKVEAQRG